MEIIQMEDLRRNLVIRQSFENLMELEEEIRDDVLAYIIAQWEDMGVYVPVAESVRFIHGLGSLRSIILKVTGSFKE